MENPVEDLPRILHEALLADATAAFERDMLRRLALAYIDHPKVWHLCKDVLKQFKGIVREVEKRVKMLAREMQEIPSIGGSPAVERGVSEIWPGCPVGNDVFVPFSYQCADATPAIERIEHRMVGDAPYEKRHAVSLDPIVISRRIGHMQSKSLLLEVSFRTNQGWRRIVAERDVVMSTRKIVDAARQGLPVSTGNALEVTEWLRHYETANRLHIPMGYASGSMGWQGEEDNPTHHGFLCGRRQIGANGLAIELDGSDGDMAEAKEIRARGSFEVWRDTMTKLVRFPAIKVAMCAALAAPLIAILEAPNGIIEWAGRTSTGKSTVLKIAQSCWRSASYDMATWDTTTIGIEAAAKFQCDLPLIIDDTSTAGDASKSPGLTKAIYQLISGRARGRATRDGNQRTRSRWRTLVLMTGETPAGELAKAEGASARVLTFWSNPLGATTSETAELIASAKHMLSNHYGHAGPRVVQWLCDNRDKWDQLREYYRQQAEIARREICTPAASRLAEIVGLLETAAFVGAAAGCMPWIRGTLTSDPEIAAAMTKAMTLATSSADRAYDAWECINGEAHARPNAWIGWGEKTPDKDPPGGWLGYSAANEFAWFPQQLRKVLTQHGFNPEAALRAWKDVGALVSTERGRYTAQCRPWLGYTRNKIRLIRVSHAYPGETQDDDSDVVDDLKAPSDDA